MPQHQSKQPIKFDIFGELGCLSIHLIESFFSKKAPEVREIQCYLGRKS